MFKKNGNVDDGIGCKVQEAIEIVPYEGFLSQVITVTNSNAVIIKKNLLKEIKIKRKWLFAVTLYRFHSMETQ